MWADVGGAFPEECALLVEGPNVEGADVEVEVALLTRKPASYIAS